jgi:hypothetical protein
VLTFTRAGRTNLYVENQSGMGRFVDWDRLRLRTTSGGNALALSDRDGRSFDRPHIMVEVNSI